MEAQGKPMTAQELCDGFREEVLNKMCATWVALMQTALKCGEHKLAEKQFNDFCMETFRAGLFAALVDLSAVKNLPEEERGPFLEKFYSDTKESTLGQR